MNSTARRLILPAALFALSLAVFGQVSSHSFLLNWDDMAYVVDNETIRGLTWSHIRAAFAAPYFNNYAPLHLLSYALDYSLWGLRPGPFLLTNVLLHSANGWLAFSLLKRLGLTNLGAFVGAAVFIVHPVQVESVAWVSERKNLLCMTFSLGAIHAYLTSRLAAAERGRWVAYVAALVLCCAALLTKAAAVVLPLILFLLDVCHIDGPRRSRWHLDKAPFVLAAVALAIGTIASQGDALTEGRAVFEMSPAATVFTMIPVVARYLGLLVWPAHLSAMYTPEIRQVPDTVFFTAAGLIAAILVGGAFLWRRARKAFCWYAIFFVGLVPVLHVVPLPTLMNDRYLYFPMLGVTGLAALLVDRVAGLSLGALRATLVTSALVCGALAVAAFDRTGAWRDDLSLWKDVTEKTPRATLAWVGLGMAYSDAGRVQDAIPAYRRAIAEDPYYALALNNLGGAYNQVGRPVEARQVLLRAIAVQPDDFNAHMNLGVACRMTGDVECAERSFRTAATLRPGAPEPFAELRILRAQVGQGGHRGE